jgi:endonuclease/exonuclease/phosphatase family metal-dependent hydrolase
VKRTFYCVVGFVFVILCCTGKEGAKASPDVLPGADTVPKTVVPPTAELMLPAENAAFDLWNDATVIFQWKVTGIVPGGCKVLISQSADVSADMASTVAFFPVTEQSPALAATPAALDDMLAGWNISPNTEATVYWTVAAKAESQSVSVKSQPRAVKLKRMPANNVVRVMSYNILHGEGLDGQINYQRIADIILNTAPDVVALQELDSATTRGGKQYLPHLDALTAVPYYSMYGPAFNLGGGKYGIGVLSKQPPLSWKYILMPCTDIYDPVRVVLIAEFEDYVFCCTHFSLVESDRYAYVGIINQAVQDFNKPVILAGDLNDSPGSSVMNTFKQKWNVLSDPSRFTFPADAPTATIDYILGYTGKGYKYPVVQTQVLNEPVASDHRPLFVDVRVIIN